eukprot:RCo051887
MAAKVVVPDSGGVYYAEDGTASVVLEDNYDATYVPSEKEVLEYAQWLGMDPDDHAELLWIARKGLQAPLPENWKPCKSDKREVYYFNFATGESLWDHPMDQHFKELFAQEKAKLEETRRAKAAGSKQTEEDAGNRSGAFPEEKRDATSGSPENGKSNDASARSVEVTVGKDTIENATGSALRKEANDADKKGTPRC